MHSRDLALHASARGSEKGQRHRSQAEFVAAAKKNVPLRIEFPHPLTWWRTRPASSFTAANVAIARSVLRKSAIIGVSHWFLGADGDAAVALAVAAAIRKQQKPKPIAFDLAMTAVLCVAFEGDAAAAIFLSAVLEPISHALSDSWLTDEGRRMRAAIRASKPRSSRVRPRPQV